MDPGRHELLVHITASSTAQDDKRYIAMARSVLDFRPALITKVSGPTPDLSFPLSSKSNDNGADDLPMASSHNLPRAPLPRPTTAPELSSIVEPGSTPSLRRDRRRAHSDASSISNSFSALDRPKFHRVGSEVEPSVAYFKGNLHSQPRQCESGTLLVFANSARKRKKPWTSVVGDIHMHPSKGGRSGQIDADTPSCPRTPERDQFVCEGVAVDDSDSTQSASPSHLMNYRRAAATDDESQKPHHQLVIDLTTPERQVSCSHPSPTSRPAHVKLLRPAKAPTCTHPETPLPFVTSKNRIRQRPDEVQPLRKFLPHGSQPSFTTHITIELNKLTVQLKHFRPAFVARDVKVLERGYWQLRVRVVEPPKPDLKLLGSTARRKRDQPDAVRTNHALWTEDEFVRVWDNVARAIELGKAGWGTRLVKDSTDEILWRIRIFTFGETLAHIWLMLFNVSNKKTGVISMEWVAAGGQVVVQMTPGKNLEGIWERKGLQGAQAALTFAQGRPSATLDGHGFGQSDALDTEEAV